MIGRWLLLFLALSLSARAAEAWRLTRVFPPEFAVLDDVAFPDGMARARRSAPLEAIATQP